MFCLLTTSIFAVPTNIAGSAAEIGQDLRFAFLSSNLSTSFYNLFTFSFLKLRTSTNPTPVVSIQVFPGSVTIQQGEKATFSAIGFDADGEPVSGLNLDWEVTEVGLGLPYNHLDSSTFEGKLVGTFLISAKNNGLQAQATVVVTPSAEYDPDQPPLQSMPTRVISSRTDLADAQDDKDTKKPNEKSKN